MKVGNMKYLLFVLLLVAVLITAGCTSGNQNVVAAPTITTTPTTTITPIVTVIPTANKTVATQTTTIPTAIITTTPTPDPTDVSEITFLHYTADDLDVQYPSGWSVNRTGREETWCGERATQNICFVGWRNITFASPDKILKFIITIRDFREPGSYILKNNQDWCEDSIYENYPGVSAPEHISYYKYFFDGKYAASTYDAIMPKSSEYYPLAYTEKSIVTFHHVYSFKFVTDNENFIKYHNLKEWMIPEATSTDTVA